MPRTTIGILLAIFLFMGHGLAMADTTCEFALVWDIAGAALVPGEIAESRDRRVDPYGGFTGFKEYNEGVINLFANVTGLHQNPSPNTMRVAISGGMFSAPGCDSSGCGDGMWVVLRGKHKLTGATHVSTYLFNSPGYLFPGAHFFAEGGPSIRVVRVPIYGVLNPEIYTYYVSVQISRTSHPYDGTGLYGDIWPDYPIRIHSIELKRETCTGTID